MLQGQGQYAGPTAPRPLAYGERMGQIYEATFSSLTDLHVELIELRARLLGNVAEPAPSLKEKQDLGFSDSGILAAHERLAQTAHMRIVDAVAVIRQIRSEL